MKRILMKLILIFLILAWFIFAPLQQDFADYVLPYPSYMPGNKFYHLSILFDQLKAYWYWGNIASVKYHLGLADKYLVEAKTLFEYNQYLLASVALQRSDNQFQLVPVYLQKAAKEGKDITKLRKIVSEAAEKHIEVLTKLTSELPAEFTWTPEKEKPTKLDIGRSLNDSIKIRKLGF